MLRLRDAWAMARPPTLQGMARMPANGLVAQSTGLKQISFGQLIIATRQGQQVLGTCRGFSQAPCLSTSQPSAAWRTGSTRAESAALRRGGGRRARPGPRTRRPPATCPRSPGIQRAATRGGGVPTNISKYLAVACLAPSEKPP